MKKFTCIIGVIMVVALGVALFGCNFDTGQADALDLISVKINPEIELVANGRGRVIAAFAVNEDAEVLLADIDLVGMDAEQAVEKIVELAIEAGYIKDDSNAQLLIGVYGGSKNAKACTRLCKRLMTRAQKALQKKGRGAQVKEQNLLQFSTRAQELGVSADKAKLIERLIELDESLETNRLKKIDTQELITLFKEQACLGLGKGQLQALNRERAQLREQYADMFALEEQVRELQQQLKEHKGQEQVKLELEQELAVRQERLIECRNDFERELQEQLAEKQQEQEQVREQRRSQLQQRKQETKGSTKGKNK